MHNCTGKKLSILVATYILATVCYIGAVRADEHTINPLINEKFKFEVGGFNQDAILKLSAGPADEELDIIDLNSLGANENDKAVWLAGRWRINRRWHVNLSFVDVDRTGVANATEEFEFGESPDEVAVTVGATVNSTFKTNYYIVQGGYNFVSTNRTNLGMGAGIHIMELAASISAQIMADGMTTNLGTGSSSTTAPLPNIYLYGDYAFTPRLAVTGSISWFGLEIDQYDGKLVSINANLEYRPWKNFGIGVGYTQVNVDVTINENDSILKFEVDTSGPRLYLTASFGSVR